MSRPVRGSKVGFDRGAPNGVAGIQQSTGAGARRPATLAGTLEQQTDEGLAVATLSQYIRAGAPIMYGALASNVDMQSGAPALGIHTLSPGGNLYREIP